MLSLADFIIIFVLTVAATVAMVLMLQSKAKKHAIHTIQNTGLFLIWTRRAENNESYFMHDDPKEMVAEISHLAAKKGLTMLDLGLNPEDIDSNNRNYHSRLSELYLTEIKNCLKGKTRPNEFVACGILPEAAMQKAIEHHKQGNFDIPFEEFYAYNPEDMIEAYYKELALRFEKDAADLLKAMLANVSKLAECLKKNDDNSSFFDGLANNNFLRELRQGCTEISRKTWPPLQVEIKFYEANRAEFLQEHSGEYVVIKKKQVLGFYADEHLAYQTGVKHFGLTDFLLRKVEPEDVANTSPVGLNLHFAD